MTRGTTRRPQAVEVTSWLWWLLVLGGLGVSIFVVLDRDSLADHWKPLHANGDTIQPVSFVPVVVVLYAVISLTVLILIALFRAGQAWSRYALTVFGLGLVVGSFSIMRTSPPTSVRWALFLSAAIGAAGLVFLWHPSVNPYMRGVDQDHEGDAPERADHEVPEAGAQQ